MDVFELRDRVVGEYRRYAESFVEIADQHIRDEVEGALDAGLLWPHPRIGLNPAFESGASVEELVESGRLHTTADQIFRTGKSTDDSRGNSLTLHRHQAEAVESAAAGRNYVLTTGTGSGKSLAYIIPAVDHVLSSGSGQGIKALVLYPMNALANSQYEELSKFLDHGPWATNPGNATTRPVTFAVYTGQQKQNEREAILSNPPDILLTNYVMAELILTRYIDKALVRAMSSLRFLVLDELHTHRGRQGADVAMLVRRIREATGASAMQCVGTSATLSTEGSPAERDARVAEVASKLFGAEVHPVDIISETLRRVTPDRDIATLEFAQELARRVDSPLSVDVTEDEFLSDPLSIWIESTFGLDKDPTGRLVRATPIPIAGPEGGGERLAAATGLPSALCEQAIQDQLLTASRFPGQTAGRSVFAFRLHQFLSAGDTAYATPETPGARETTMRAQRFVRDDRNRSYLPLAFCRYCGQEYYIVRRTATDHGAVFMARDLGDTGNDEGDPGFLFIDPHSDAPIRDSRNAADATNLDEEGPRGGPWPTNREEIENRLPSDWFDANRQLRDGRRDSVPRPVAVTAGGALHPTINGASPMSETDTGQPGATTAFWLPTPFRFCMNCGVSYTGRLGGDFTRLGTFGSQGRSTVTTITSLATVNQLRETAELSSTAHKLLSFTDNRQDASLQAGHLNDFVEVTMLRSSLYQALREAGEEGLHHDNVAQRVVEALDLPPEAYALQPEARGQARSVARQAFTEAVSYRLYLDLRRGWRITQPNLEQCGLLRIGYQSLEELAADEQEWATRHPALAQIDADTRLRILEAMLDVVRRELAIRVGVLDRDNHQAMQQRSEQNLRDPWSLEGERLEYGSAMVIRPRRQRDDRSLTHLGPRSSFGQFLNRLDTLGSAQHLRLDDRQQIIEDLAEALHAYGLLHQAGLEDDGTALWQLPAGAMRWELGHGQPYHDPIRMPSGPERGITPNPYFVALYTGETTKDRRLEAREHTAQVPHEQRAEREHRFRNGELPMLFCSPTMELGVDIAELNVVNMRNVPPTPANYAQRSGRAGRSGQPALVTTFCATGNSHDQHFLRHQEQMVAGQVEAPRLDLANEDLVRAHVHSVWLAHSGLNLGNKMGELLDLSGDQPSLELMAQVADTLADQAVRSQAQARARAILENLRPELAEADWWTDDWLNDTMQALRNRFEGALERWRSLYRSALRQSVEQGRIRQSAGRTSQDRRQAERLRREAERQLDLLRGDLGDGFHSDFYPYRYLAAEGFLPGYSFPRLPLSAFVPGRHRLGTEFLQRPRFLAISEFSPHSLIYHEGNRYQVNRVILDAEDFENDHDGGSIITTSIKRCRECGYLHADYDTPGPDVCEHCGEPLPPQIGNMFRLRNVATRRRDRITSDEEQRERRGYDIVAAVRFARRQSGRSVRERTLYAAEAGGAPLDGGPALRLSYGDAATIWRINEGPRRRANRAQLGFVLDVERGYWARDADAAEGDADPAHQDPLSQRTVRVIPYVTDARNALLIEPVVQSAPDSPGSAELAAAELGVETMASVQAALTTALQVVFQLEPNEIAAEPLPSLDNRRQLLVYEAAEGGAGALKQLVDDPSLWLRIASEALRRCHAHPDTGEDQDGPGGVEPCEAACYDCLMSYSNQGDHALLDRRLAIEYLAPLTRGAAFARDEHDAGLAESAESGLEQQFLSFLERGGYRRPDRAQVYFETAQTRPDFVYDEACAVIYVNGPHHDYPERAARDAIQEQAMNDLGYQVIRFGHADDWQAIVDRHPAVFGPGGP
ncbi:MAG: DEAD/DEAH box helicase [bacterium]|nr:DEAD/DEAH box helicase [bacterium]